MDNPVKIKLLIVDDAYYIRELFRNTIDWNLHNVEVVGIAEDGVDAIEYIKKYEPDIVLTDVRMPGMDGIELSGWINENHPGIRVILFSAYSDFEYARKAIRYNVTDYLLKPVDNNILFEIIERISSGINQKIKEDNEYERLKSIVEKNMPVMREKYIHDILEGKYSYNIEELFKLYGIDLTGDSYIIVIISVEYRTLKDADVKDKNIMPDVLKLELADVINSLIKYPYKAYLFNEGSESLGVVFSVAARYEKSYTVRSIVGILNKIRDFFSEKEYILTAGVSNMSGDIKVLKNCYLEALKALRAKVYLGKGNIICYSALESENTKFAMDACETDKIFEYFKIYDWFNVRMSVKRYFDYYTANHNILENHSRFIIYELISILKKAIAYDCNSSEIVIGEEEVERLSGNLTLQEMNDGVLNLYKKHFDIMAEQRGSNSNKIVQKIKEYIDNNYIENMKLTRIAESLFLSTSSLSKLFFKETGRLFSDYIMQYRINKAKELILRTDLKIYEIYEKVGYQSKKNFFRQFKKVTGISPMEFKKTMQQDKSEK